MFRLTGKSFFGRLMVSHMIIIFISLVVIGIMFGYLVQNYYFGLKEWEAVNNGRRIAQLVRENVSGGDIGEGNIEDVDTKITTISRSSNMDIAIMDSNGEIVIETSDIHDYRIALEEEEIEHVLQGNSITKKMMGPEHKNLLMLVPMVEEEEREGSIEAGPQEAEHSRVVGGIIIGTALGGIATTANNITRLIFFSFLVALVAATFLTVSFTRWVTGPLKKLKDSALGIARGEFKAVRIPEHSSEEIRHLSNTFNYAVQQIKDTLDKKRRLEKMRKEFVQDVSHEFRAPLTSVKGFLELLSASEHELEPEEVKRYTEIMYRDTEYLEHLLSDLLDLAKLDSEEIRLHTTQISPRELVERAVNSLENRFREKDIELEIDIENGVPEVEVDANRMHQVLINLLDNAINYSPPAGKITITVERESASGDGGQKPEKAGGVRFAVADNGSGIPEDKQGEIWNRFFKVEQARTRKQKNGSGLGLAIVKNIIERHGGEIWVESSRGKGARFIFVLYR